MNTNNRKKWNKKEDQVLLELVNVCGEHWADLTRAYN